MVTINNLVEFVQGQGGHSLERDEGLGHGAGETDNYGFRFAVESGIPLIETSHELSENPGIRRFTSLLAANFPEVAFAFYENQCTWSTG
jgi:hypothetical protein